MDKTVYVIWNKKDDRPTICEHNYGNLLVYLTKEQAQAYMATQALFETKYGEDYFIKEIQLIPTV